jgi:hypothetical protein
MMNQAEVMADQGTKCGMTRESLGTVRLEKNKEPERHFSAS